MNKGIVVIILTMSLLVACDTDQERKFVGSWTAKFTEGINAKYFPVRFNEDGTFHFDFEEGSKPFGGTYYVISVDNVIAFDNLESNINEDLVGKYKFLDGDNLEISFLGLKDTMRVELKRIKK